MCWSRHPSAFAAAALLTACATTTPPESAAAIRFACDGGRTIGVTFGNGVARVQDDAGLDVTLPQSETGSGFLYQSPRHSIRGKGDDLTYTIGRMAPMQCKALR